MLDMSRVSCTSSLVVCFACNTGRDHNYPLTHCCYDYRRSLHRRHGLPSKPAWPLAFYSCSIWGLPRPNSHLFTSRLYTVAIFDFHRAAPNVFIEIPSGSRWYDVTQTHHTAEACISIRTLSGCWFIGSMLAGQPVLWGPQLPDSWMSCRLAVMKKGYLRQLRRSLDRDNLVSSIIPLPVSSRTQRLSSHFAPRLCGCGC
jgi:hypothetical protein